MLSNATLLPINSTPWERAMADAMSPVQEVVDGVGAIRGAKLVSLPPSFLPFLVWEYGLNELTPYLPNLYDLIDQGIDWQRVRGTPNAIAIGLGWLGHTVILEEAATARLFWNSFQLRFDALPANDNPDLERVEGITALSVPKRSVFRRGIFQYDLGPLMADTTRLDASMLDRESGISVTQAGTLWSFGRVHEFAHVLSETEGNVLGNWIEPIVDGGVTWEDLNIPWSAANFAWNADGVSQRAATLAAWFFEKNIYVAFKDIADQVIGYRRAFAHQVDPVASGPYSFNAISYGPAEGGSSLYVEARTQFGDVGGEEAKSISLIISPTLTENTKPGKLWISAEELSGGSEIALSGTTIGMRTTVREQIKFLVRF